MTICLRCKVTSHENHVSDDLQEVARVTREHLNTKLEGAKLHLPLFHEQLNDANRYEENMVQTKDRLVKTINQRATKLHDKVDKLAATLIHDVDSEYNVETARIDSHRKKITQASKALAGQIHAANQAVMYGADAEIARNKDLLVQQMENITTTAERLQLPKLTLELSPSITLEGKIEESFGSLSTRRPPAVDIKIQEMAVFQVDDTFKVVSSICPVGDGEAWVTSGWKPEIHLFNVYGTRLRTQSVGRNIDSIIQDKSKSLIVTCSDQRQILRSHGNIDFSIIATLGQHPRGIALTEDNELLVCTGQSLAFQDYKDGHKNKVLRYSVDGRMTGEFGDEDQWKFMYPLRIAVNMTGDICIADCQRRCVTIHRRDGTLKAKYTGAETSGLKNSFEPRGLACDSRGFIFVTDNANDAIHLLDHSGKFIRLILTSNDEVYGPYATAIDSKGFLWVGARDATVKVFKVTYI
ncbi:TRIM56 [Mytilus edulis]|nr:TRIM56 [Mytilus edulis]